MDINSNFVALVTGGASGLGEATVRRLVQDGARCLIVDRNVERGEAVSAELGDAVEFAEADVCDEAQVQAAVTQASGMGELRLVVQCAGVGWAARTVNRDGSPHDLGLFQTVVNINLVGHFNVLRLSTAEMSKLGPQESGERGLVVNTASVAAFDGQIGQAAYAASKAGVVGMTLPIARDLSKVGIRVLTICPGTFDTPMLAMLPEDKREALAATIPFPKRLGSPSEYASLVRHMVENAYLNAETVRLDGAIRMAPR